MAAANISPEIRRTIRRAAFLVTSEEPADISQGVRLILAIPREYRHHIAAAVDYFTAQLEVELHAEDEARAEKALAAIE